MLHCCVAVMLRQSVKCHRIVTKMSCTNLIRCCPPVVVKRWEDFLFFTNYRPKDLEI